MTGGRLVRRNPTYSPNSILSFDVTLWVTCEEIRFHPSTFPEQPSSPSDLSEEQTGDSDRLYSDTDKRCMLFLVRNVIRINIGTGWYRSPYTQIPKAKGDARWNELVRSWGWWAGEYAYQHWPKHTHSSGFPNKIGVLKKSKSK